MEGLTGVIFRQVHSRFFGGADQYYIPFVTPTTLPKFTERQLRELAPEVNAGFEAVPQLLTRRTEDFIWAAKALADLGYTEVNLNLDQCYLHEQLYPHKFSHLVRCLGADSRT